MMGHRLQSRRNANRLARSLALAALCLAWPVSIASAQSADLAVLSADYMTAPVMEIGKIRSVLTMVGGEAVYAAAPFAKLAPAELH